MPYRLVPTVPAEKSVGEVLHELLEEFKNDNLTGLAFVKMRRRGRFKTEVVGACVSNATLARGAVCELDDKLAILQHGVHPDDTR